MWVMTVDQIGSRRVGDRVDELLDQLDREGPLATTPAAPGLVRQFERTAGDEVQAIFDNPELTVKIALHLLHMGGWSVGIGSGAVDTPLPEHARAGSGPAFVLAREALEAVKSRRRQASPPVAVRGVHADIAAEAEAVLVLLGTIDARRSVEGHAVVERLRQAGRPIPQDELAAELGISQQAISARLRTALWSEEEAVLPAAARLLALSDGSMAGEVQ